MPKKDVSLKPDTNELVEELQDTPPLNISLFLAK